MVLSATDIAQSWSVTSDSLAAWLAGKIGAGRLWIVKRAKLSAGSARLKDLIAATNIKPKTAIFIHANDSFGTAQRQTLDKVFPTAGLPFRLVKSIAYDPKAQDLSVEVTKIRGHNPDVVLAVPRAADAIKLVRDMVRQHTEQDVVGPAGREGNDDPDRSRRLRPSRAAGCEDERDG